MASPDALPQELRRVIDANLNRSGEGLRILEEMARLVLGDVMLSQRLKTLRHGLLSRNPTFNKELIEARNAESDAGIGILAPGQEEKDLSTLVVASARRVQESLHTVEEIVKLKGITPQLDPEKLKKARLQLYSLERELLSRLLRQDKAERISGLHAIIDTQALRGRSHIEVAREIIRGGAKTVQLRDKLTNKRELVSIAQQLKALCAEHNVLFIVNDYLDLALAADADGLHLGQEDLPIKIARRLLPIDKILGCSTHSPEQAKAAESDGADYIAIGSIYPTPSKETAVIAGLDGLRQVRETVSLPVVAIGGITEGNVAEVIAAGASSVAVISAILSTESPEAATRQIVARIEMQHG